MGRVTRKSSNAEVNEFDEGMKKLCFIASSRQTLEKRGFKDVKRVLSWKLKEKMERFKKITEKEPTIYRIGTEKWIYDLLQWVNQPTILTYDDVTDWLANANDKAFFMAPPATDVLDNVKLVPLKQEPPRDNVSDKRKTMDEPMLQRDKKPRLKLAIVKLIDCVKNPVVGVVPGGEDELLKEIDTHEFSQKVDDFIKHLDNDDSMDCPEKGLELHGLGPEAVKAQTEGVKLDEMPVIANDKEAPVAAVTQEVLPPHGVEVPAVEDVPDVNVRAADSDDINQVENPMVAQAPDAQEGEGELQINNTVDYMKADAQAMEGMPGNTYYPVHNELIRDDEDEEQFLENANVTNNAVCNSQKKIGTPAFPSPKQTPTESLELPSSQCSNGTSGSNELSEVLNNFLNQECEAETVATAIDHSNQSQNQSQRPTAAPLPDPNTETYKNLIIRTVQFISNNNPIFDDQPHAPAPSSCSICAEHFVRSNTIQHLTYHLDSHVKLLYSPIQNINFGHVNAQYCEIDRQLRAQLAKQEEFLNSGTCSECGTNVKTLER